MSASLDSGKSEAYHERNMVVALLARHYPSWTAKTDIPGWDSEWHNCVYVELPTGQVSWHYHESEHYLFDKLAHSDGRVWDGHTTDQKYNRLIAAMVFQEQRNRE